MSDNQQLIKEQDDWIAAFKILAKNMPGIDIDLNDPIGTATKIDEAIHQKMTNMSTLIESYARDNRPCNWSHQEMYRLGFGDIKSGINADCVALLSEKYEQVKKELDDIKNSSTPVAWGVRMPKAKLWRCSSEKQAKKCVEYFGKGEVVTLFEKPQPILTQAEQKAVEYAHGLIKYYASIADRRYDYNTYYHDHRDALAGLLARYKLVAGGEVEG